MPRSKATSAIGPRLRALREAAGLTQGQVAEAIGLTRGGISFIESGIANPSLGTLEAYVAATGGELLLAPVETRDPVASRLPALAGDHQRLLLELFDVIGRVEPGRVGELERLVRRWREDLDVRGR